MFQAGQLDFPRNIMCPSNVIHAVLGRTLPNGAPRHWAPPQLGQVQMKSRHVPIHITLNPYPTVHTTTRLTLTENPAWPLHASPYVTNDRRWPLLAQCREFRNGNRRFRHISHVHNHNVTTFCCTLSTTD